MSSIFWDTNLFIYLIEEYGELSVRTKRLAARMLERNDQLYTSCLTLGEVLVKPTTMGNTILIQAYQDVISRHAALISFDETAARHYAGIRADRTVKAPDAIQLACAAKERVDLFITNDDRLSQRVIPGIQFIVSLSRAPI